MITASRPPSGSPLTAVASKRNVTVVDITSTRMLMAHGFLHRLFGVFEHHATSVDVVTTSEVSVSVTVDDVRRLPRILEDLQSFAEVHSSSDLAVLCVVGEGNATASEQMNDVLAQVSSKRRTCCPKTALIGAGRYQHRTVPKPGQCDPV